MKKEKQNTAKSFRFVEPTNKEKLNTTKSPRPRRRIKTSVPPCDYSWNSLRVWLRVIQYIVRCGNLTRERPNAQLDREDEHAGHFYKSPRLGKNLRGSNQSLTYHVHHLFTHQPGKPSKADAHLGSPQRNKSTEKNAHPPRALPRTPRNKRTKDERSSNKRTADTVAGHTLSRNKRTKTNATASPAVAGSSKRNAIDLTSKVPNITYVPTGPRHHRRNTNRIFNTQRPHTDPHPYYRNKNWIFNTQRPPIQRKQLIQGETTGIMVKIASKLRASQHALQVDRETLRKRWDVDEHLQLVHITDQLVELTSGLIIMLVLASPFACHP